MPIYVMHCPECGGQRDIYRRLTEIDKDLPVCCVPMVRKICAAYVQSDIQPYQAMGADIKTNTAPVIHGRSQHREYLKRNGYVEVGNEMPKLREEVRGDFNIRKELTEATHRVLSDPKHVR